MTWSDLPLRKLTWADECAEDGLQVKSSEIEGKECKCPSAMVRTFLGQAARGQVILGSLFHFLILPRMFE